LISAIKHGVINCMYCCRMEGAMCGFLSLFYVLWGKAQLCFSQFGLQPVT